MPSLIFSSARINKGMSAKDRIARLEKDAERKLSDAHDLVFIDESKPILMEHHELQQKAYKVNNSIREFCNLYEVHLREERETLKMTYECMEKFSAMTADKGTGNVSPRKNQKYSIGQFWIDIWLFVLLLVTFVVCIKWVCYAEEYSQRVIHQTYVNLDNWLASLNY